MKSNPREINFLKNIYYKKIKKNIIPINNIL